MSLKDAALLALAGTGLLTFVLVVSFTMEGWAVFDGVIPVISLLVSLVRVFAGVSMTIFLYVFYKKAA